MSNKLWIEGKPNIPKYIENIIKNVQYVGLYTFKLIGANRYRPAYGIHEDTEKLAKWAERHGAEFIVKSASTEKHNHYVIFEMTDPVVHALEEKGLLQ